MRERIIQEIQELREKVWTDYQEDNFGYPEWFDHLDSVDSVDDIIRAISKWDFDDTDNAVFYYTKITALENVLYAMEEEE
tara:strand:- start:38 stop:277 length:240 start_codon:yes stop_codon:yes gene_type:complete